MTTANDNINHLRIDVKGIVIHSPPTAGCGFWVFRVLRAILTMNDCSLAHRSSFQEHEIGDV
jgi:hypothetical protein